MARNGSGVYSPSATGYPAVAGTTIESAKYNAVLADIATALTGSIACNGESTITGNIPLSGYKLTGVGNATADADALNRVTADARYAALTGATFTGEIALVSASPQLTWLESDAAADNKRWDTVAVGEALLFRALNDAFSVTSNWGTVQRTGTTVDSITFAGTTIAVTGALTVNSIAITPSEGTFTARLRATIGGADIATVTAKWKKVGNVVHLRIPNLTGTSTAATYYIQSLPAAIQAADTQFFAVAGYNNSQVQITAIVYASQDYIQLTTDTGGTFDSGSNTKGLLGTTLTYLAD